MSTITVIASDLLTQLKTVQVLLKPRHQKSPSLWSAALTIRPDEEILTAVTTNLYTVAYMGSHGPVYDKDGGEPETFILPDTGVAELIEFLRKVTKGNLDAHVSIQGVSLSVRIGEDTYTALASSGPMFPLSACLTLLGREHSIDFTPETGQVQALTNATLPTLASAMRLAKATAVHFYTHKEGAHQVPTIWARFRDLSSDNLSGGVLIQAARLTTEVRSETPLQLL